MTDTTPQPGVVTFDYAAWSAAYPELASSVTEAAAQARFDMATAILDNSAFSTEPDVTKRTRLLYLLTAHIAFLFLPQSQGGRGADSVGRLASATRGSVSVSFDAGSTAANQSWFAQTQYGLMFWQATIYLRQMRILPGRSARARIWP